MYVYRMSRLGYTWKYIKHFLIAKDAHRLHSPLAFSFYNIVLHPGRGLIKAEVTIEAIRRSLESDRTVIEVLDLGAGPQSRHPAGPGARSGTSPGTSFVSPLVASRQVGEIAKHALKSHKLAFTLYRLAAWHKPRVIIELGTSLGITSAYLSHAVPRAKIISIEGSPVIAGLARRTHKLAGARVEVLDGNFDDLLPVVLDQLDTDDFILYVDGNHTYEATLRYFEMGCSKAGERTLIVFDDIHWSHEMELAWAAIVQDEKVTLSIDTFFFGLVFFETTRATQHFKVR